MTAHSVCDFFLTDSFCIEQIPRTWQGLSQAWQSTKKPEVYAKADMKFCQSEILHYSFEASKSRKNSDIPLLIFKQSSIKRILMCPTSFLNDDSGQLRLPRT